MDDRKIITLCNGIGDGDGTNEFQQEVNGYSLKEKYDAIDILTKELTEIIKIPMSSDEKNVCSSRYTRGIGYLKESIAADERSADEKKELEIKWYNTFYSFIIEPNIDKVLNSYKSLYESGFDLNKPYGIVNYDTDDLQDAEVMKIDSNGKLSLVDRNRLDINGIYNTFTKKLNYVELKGDLRYTADTYKSSKLSNILLEYYNKLNDQGRILYLPVLQVAIAYCRHINFNKDDEITFTTKASTTKFDKYVNENFEDDLDLKKYIKNVLLNCLYNYLHSIGASENISGNSEDVKKLINFCTSSLCASLLFIEYQVVNESVVSVRLRVSDRNNLLDDEKNDVMGDLNIKLYNRERKFAEKPIFYSNGIKEYASIFNSDLKYAMPLFAYKAYDLRSQYGISGREAITWNNMVVGQYENGLTLINGNSIEVAGNTPGSSRNVKIDLTNHFLHNISAGSRSGKGVMTLTFLVGALAAKRPIFYLDDKPDMSSMLMYLTNGHNKNVNEYPEMFTLNGEGYKADDDSFKVMAERNSWINKKNIPKYLAIADVLGVEGSESYYRNIWALAYFRAMLLAYGIAYSYCTDGSSNAKELSENGIVVVLDEVSNAQKSEKDIFNKLAKIIAGDKKEVIDKYSSKLDGELRNYKEEYIKNESKGKYKGEDGKKLKDIFVNKVETSIKETVSKYEGVLSSAGEYSVIFFQAMYEGLNYLDETQNAGFQQEGFPDADIIVIGQNLSYKRATFSDIKAQILDCRPKKEDKGGINGNGDTYFNTNSILEYFIDYKATDAFLGYEPKRLESQTLVGNDGPDYLGQSKKESRAYSKLTDKARYFAYIDTYDEHFKSEALSPKGANKAVFFKPYLLLNDMQADTNVVIDEDFIASNKQGNYKEGYPLDKIKLEQLSKDPNHKVAYPMDQYTRQLISHSSVEPLYQIVEENGVVDHDVVTFDPRVGFGNYLQSTGVSEEEYVETLKKSADIANTVVKNMGYKGDGSDKPLWLQFVLDLRVESIFNVKDVVEAVNKGKEKENQNISYYAEYYDIINSINTIKNIKLDWLDIDKSDNAESDRSQCAKSFGGNRDAEAKKVENAEMQSAGIVFGNNPTITENEKVNVDVEEPTSAYTEKEQKDIQTDLSNTTKNKQEEASSGIDDIVNEANGNNQQEVQKADQAIQKEDKALKEQSSRPTIDVAHVENVDLNDAGKYESEIESAVGNNNSKDDVSANGRTGLVISKDGKVLDPRQDFVNDEHMYYTSKELEHDITQDVIHQFGGMSRITSLAMVGQNLVVNNCTVKYIYDHSKIIENLPVDVVNQINDGNIAALFDWSVLPNLSKLQALSFSSRTDVFNYVTPKLGWRNPQVNQFFKACKRLELLEMEGTTFTRANYKELEKTQDPFYKENKAAMITDSMSSGLFKGAKYSMSHARKDLNSKGWLNKIKAGFWLQCAAVTGILTLGSKGAHGIAKSVEGDHPLTEGNVYYDESSRMSRLRKKQEDADNPPTENLAMPDFDEYKYHGTGVNQENKDDVIVPPVRPVPESRRLGNGNNAQANTNTNTQANAQNVRQQRRNTNNNTNKYGIPRTYVEYCRNSNLLDDKAINTIDRNKINDEINNLKANDDGARRIFDSLKNGTADGETTYEDQIANILPKKEQMTLIGKYGVEGTREAIVKMEEKGFTSEEIVMVLLDNTRIPKDPKQRFTQKLPTDFVKMYKQYGGRNGVTPGDVVLNVIKTEAPWYIQDAQYNNRISEEGIKYYSNSVLGATNVSMLDVQNLFADLYNTVYNFNVAGNPNNQGNQNKGKKFFKDMRDNLKDLLS